MMGGTQTTPNVIVFQHSKLQEFLFKLKHNEIKNLYMQISTAEEVDDAQLPQASPPGIYQ